MEFPLFFFVHFDSFVRERERNASPLVEQRIDSLGEEDDDDDDEE